jgi:type IV secretory pathway VirB10-like protein
VPDGNPTVTLVLAGGARRAVPVVDHNALEATVPGQVVAIIDRDVFGRVSRHQLR